MDDDILLQSSLMYNRNGKVPRIMACGSPDYTSTGSYFLHYLLCIVLYRLNPPSLTWWPDRNPCWQLTSMLLLLITTLRSEIKVGVRQLNLSIRWGILATLNFQLYDNIDYIIVDCRRLIILRIFLH